MTDDTPLHHALEMMPRVIAHLNALDTTAPPLPDDLPHVQQLRYLLHGSAMIADKLKADLLTRIESAPSLPSPLAGEGK